MRNARMKMFRLAAVIGMGLIISLVLPGSPAAADSLESFSISVTSALNVRSDGEKIQTGYDNLALGFPGEADTVVDRVGYALGYIEYHEQPAWVVYKLTRDEVMTKVSKRKNRFKEDPEIATGSACSADYRQSGYDRGHLAPAADMAFSEQAMADSFFYSNMSPQHPKFNRGIWKKLEEQVRHFAVREEEVYVVTGPVLPKEKTITIGPNQVTVPTHYYKVVYDLTEPKKMIGFIVPNTNVKADLKDFAVTVRQVEEQTGLDFFSLVPQPEQDRLETTINVDDWQWSVP